MADTYGAQPIIETKEGIIQSILVDAGHGQKCWLVPMLKYKNAGGMNTKYSYSPIRDSQGRLVYAVPGGGSYTPKVAA